MADRIKFAAHWRNEVQGIAEVIKPYEDGAMLLGEKGYREYRMMQKFSHEVGDILAAIADIVQPRTYEEFEQYALQDLIGEEGSRSPA